MEGLRRSGQQVLGYGVALFSSSAAMVPFSNWNLDMQMRSPFGGLFVYLFTGLPQACVPGLVAGLAQTRMLAKREANQGDWPRSAK